MLELDPERLVETEPRAQRRDIARIATATLARQHLGEIAGRKVDHREVHADDTHHDDAGLREPTE